MNSLKQYLRLFTLFATASLITIPFAAPSAQGAGRAAGREIGNRGQGGGGGGGGGMFDNNRGGNDSKGPIEAAQKEVDEANEKLQKARAVQTEATRERSAKQADFNKAKAVLNAVINRLKEAYKKTPDMVVLVEAERKAENAYNGRRSKLVANLTSSNSDYKTALVRQHEAAKRAREVKLQTGLSDDEEELSPEERTAVFTQEIDAANNVKKLEEDSISADPEAKALYATFRDARAKVQAMLSAYESSPEMTENADFKKANEDAEIKKQAFDTADQAVKDARIAITEATKVVTEAKAKLTKAQQEEARKKADEARKQAEQNRGGNRGGGGGNRGGGGGNRGGGGGRGR